MPQSVPAYYYPTTTLFIDGPSGILEDSIKELPADFTYRLFTQSSEALTHLKESYQSSRVCEELLKTTRAIVTNPINSVSVTLDISKLYQEIYNPRRFSEVSVLVIDSEMNGMPFNDLCQKMATHPVKKILVINRNQEKLAVDALNRGYIDYVLVKGRFKTDELLNAIQILSLHYFHKMSRPIQTLLAHESQKLLFDVKFAQFFYELCYKNAIQEYYLTELGGSFLLLDKQSNVYLLAIKSYEELAIYYEYAADNGASSEFLEDIRSGNKIPVRLDSADYFKPKKPDAWESLLCPADELQCDSTYYYALAQLPDNNLIEFDRIYSHERYYTQLKQRFQS